ncbi:TPA: chitin disaccharide deacetylase [Vibrio parahaemolyticus]|nr:chitin disaccharide deacetylase [Vibrio parahaemolyticus]
MKVIFNADDFGLTQGVNNGIVKSHQDGVVKSTTMMVGMDAEQNAIELANQNPDLKIGVHLRFTAGAPLTEHPNLTNGRTYFVKYSELWNKQDFEAQAVYDEAKAQIDHFLSLGLTLSHLDSHHHAHTHPQIFPIVQKLAKEHRVPLRGSGICHQPMTTSYFFSDEFYDQKVSLDGLMQHLLSLKENYDVVEVMCHPAYADQPLIMKSGYALQRELELQVLTSPILKEQLAQHGIAVTDYSALVSTSQVVGV